jgi:GT2 family glycosyltransferase
VLFLNPDARIEADSIRRLAAVLRDEPSIGIVAPAIVDADGAPEHSLRRFPRLRSTFARALFLHRLIPSAPWVDEVVRDPERYRHAGPAEWASGACLLVRRSLLEELGGWDERFFLYGEDVDLCRRTWDAGMQVRYEPEARAVHHGGGSAPRAQLLPLLARSRVQYARLHDPPPTAFLQRIGVALGELTHAALSTKGPETRRGHWLAFLETCSEGRGPSRSASADSVPTAVEIRQPSD